jgi:uncharacterized membrane protein YtjA (UPF0391 family)
MDRRQVYWAHLIRLFVGFVTVTFEANGTAKHLFIFNVLVNLLFLLLSAEWIDLMAKRIRIRVHP